MRYSCKYNPLKDVDTVRPSLSIQLKEAVETGAIRDTGYIPEYNDIDSPDKVMMRVRDNFEAVEAMNTVKRLGLKTKPQSPPSNTTQSSAPAPTSE